MPTQLTAKTSYAFLRQKASLASVIWQRRRQLRSQEFEGQDSGFHPPPQQTHQESDRSPEYQHDSGNGRGRHHLPNVTPARIRPSHHGTIPPHSLARPPPDRGIMFLMFGRVRGPPAGNRNSSPAPFPKHPPQLYRQPTGGS